MLPKATIYVSLAKEHLPEDYAELDDLLESLDVQWLVIPVMNFPEIMVEWVEISEEDLFIGRLNIATIEATSHKGVIIECRIDESEKSVIAAVNAFKENKELDTLVFHRSINFLK